jgi:hypothetical protein
MNSVPNLISPDIRNPQMAEKKTLKVCSANSLTQNRTEITILEGMGFVR